ncbi:hypothetical protein [Streptomyces sp. ICBB 8177]|uniref:hypothetical protein n=1 Tax=Streptomyces sp. ICBB 8177 TaxID=563922 RepID=UPI000D675629|nr:hypothetical protein [Streptomyces sp. ICBB 8177]PWI41056.1 hypothetical protein CK485_27180 [Streptomyces sp. ICBB 8177]
MTTRTIPTALRAAASVAVIASGALLLTACSSSSSSSASSNASASASSSSAGGRQQMAAYTQCLSQHGVKITRPSGRPSARPSGGFRHGGGGGGGFGGFGFGGGASANPAMQKAAQACASLRPQFKGGGGNSAYATAFKAFTGCLKDHGVNLPSASSGTMGGGTRGLNTSDPKTAAAYKTCKPLLPQRGPGNPTASATPSA